jgi:threonine dehydratase
MSLITLQEIRSAAGIIAPHIHRTPLWRSRTFSEFAGAEVYLKCENLQKTGSFKPRGALQRIARLTPEERACGVLAASAGNHAQGLAFAAGAEGIPVTVVMPMSAPQAKLDATRQMGATVIQTGEIFDDALAAALELQESTGMTFVHPCTDPDMVAGAGTIGLEILEDLPDVDAVVVPVGGGALLAGIAAAVRALRPEARVWGVEPETAPAMAFSLADGRLVELDSAISIADGMAGRAVFPYTLEHAMALCAGIRLVSEEAMLQAIRLLLERAKLLTEAAGAAPLAAILDGLPDLPPGARVVAVLSGGNQDLGLLVRWLEEGV